MADPADNHIMPIGAPPIVIDMLNGPGSEILMMPTNGWPATPVIGPPVMTGPPLVIWIIYKICVLAPVLRSLSVMVIIYEPATGLAQLTWLPAIVMPAVAPLILYATGLLSVMATENDNGVPTRPLTSCVPPDGGVLGSVVGAAMMMV